MERFKPNAPKAQAVAVTTLGGALGVVVVWALKQYGGVPIEAEVGAAIGTVITAIVQRFPRIFIG